MTLIYLWCNRLRPPLCSSAWFKVWAKRGLNFFGLLVIIYRRYICQISGCTIGTLTVIGKLDLNGPAKNLVVGKRCFISSGVHLALHGGISIGDRVVINECVKILSSSHDTQSENWLTFSKQIKIEDYAWIATNAILLPGVTIGRGAVVGAGAVVTKNVPEYAIVAGNPAAKIGMRISSLNFSPVDLCAPFEAWVGSKLRSKQRLF